MSKHNVHSLLDVGAGEGTFASMVAAHANLDRYVAVEKPERTKNIQTLRDRGLEVVEREFPFETDDRFDMVLASHSIPNGKEGFEDFIEHLVRAAKEEGVVCAITYKTDKDSWYDLMRDALQENWHGKNYDTYEMLFDVLKQYGDVSVEKIKSIVRGRTPREMFPALRFIYAGKDAVLAERFDKHRKQVLEWVRKECKSDSGYEFPFFQYVVTLKKDAEQEPDPWQDLIRHPRHELNFDDVHIVVEDGVFTPNPEVTRSTSMVLEHLPSLKGKRVVDIGTGTGVIGIVAARRDAKEVVATDVSDKAIQNATENVERNNVGDRVKVTRADVLDGIEGSFDYMFANIPILKEVWEKQNIAAKTVVQKLLESAKTKLNRGGKLYIPWGSFAETERKQLEVDIVQNGYSFGLHTKEALGHRWYLYVLSRNKEVSSGTI
ncbi:MAG: class I SAM-dependent methyltransferase [Minisyncoccia bacterium]